MKPEIERLKNIGTTEIKIKCTGEKNIDWHKLKDLQLTEDGRSLKATDKNKIEKLAVSIATFGVVNNLQIWESPDGDYYCFDAHHRKKAFELIEEAGIKIPEIPATRCLAETKDEAKKLLLVKETKSSWVDVEVVGDYIKEIGMDIEIVESTIDLLEFEWSDVEKLNKEEIEEDIPPEPQEEARSVLSDIYELMSEDGRVHRVMCGDSTDRETVERLMDGKKADLVFTDPPYGVEYQSNMRTKSDKFNQLLNDDQFLDIAPIISEFSNRWVFVWTSWKVITTWIEKFESFGYPSNIVIWHKPGGGIGDLKRTFSSDYECALVWHRGAELCGKRIGSVWVVGKDAANNYKHPTQKPVALAYEALDKTTEINQIVADLFLGSGSTLIAAEQTGRVCYGMELDPIYVDVIVQRWVNFTGIKTIKKNGEKFSIEE